MKVMASDTHTYTLSTEILEHMALYIKQCIKNQASYWPLNRYQSTRTYKILSKKSASCSSATGEAATPVTLLVLE